MSDTEPDVEKATRVPGAKPGTEVYKKKRGAKRLPDGVGSQSKTAVNNRMTRRYPDDSGPISLGRSVGTANIGYIPPRQTEVKETIMETFERIGGVARYAEWADKNPREFYEHYIKILPLQIKTSIHLAGEFTHILEAARARSPKRDAVVSEQ